MPSVSKKKVELFYDVISPYSWFAFEVLQRYQSVWNIELLLKPALLGSIFKHVQATPPCRAKVNYSRRDLHYGQRYFNVPLEPVKDVSVVIFKGSLVPMRFLTSIRQNCDEFLFPASQALYMKRYNKDEDFTTEESLIDVGKSIGIPQNILENLIQSCQKEEIKTSLKELTNEAISHGAFGVPTIVTHVDGKKEVFFGSDRFPIIAHVISEEWRGPEP